MPPEKFAEKKQGEGSKDLLTERKKLQLNSAEELYAEIRDKNFNAVGAALSKKAKIISAAFEVGPVFLFTGVFGSVMSLFLHKQNRVGGVGAPPHTHTHLYVHVCVVLFCVWKSCVSDPSSLR